MNITTLKRSGFVSAQSCPLDISDEELMRRIQREDQEALEFLYDRYCNMLYGLIMKIRCDAGSSEDILQEVFIEIWNRAQSYREEKGKPLGWIITMSRRRAIDRMRSQICYRRAGDRLALEIKNQAYDWVAHVEEDVAYSEMRLFLQRALAAIPQAQKDVVELAYFRGMSQRQIAAYTGIPLGTVKTRMELALKKLAISLQGLEELL